MDSCRFSRAASVTIRPASSRASRANRSASANSTGWLTRSRVWMREIGLAPGDAVALMIRNSPIAVALLFAIAKARAIWVPINVQGRGENLGYIFNHSGPKLVIADPDLLPVITASGANLTAAKIFAIREVQAFAKRRRCSAALERACARGRRDIFRHVHVRHDRASKGRSRLPSHAASFGRGGRARVGSACRQRDVHVGAALPHRRRADDRAAADARGDARAGPQFSASRFWRQVRESGATHIHFLGGILQILLKQPPSDLDRAHGARIAWGGGCPREIWRPFEERFGMQIRECYGMTECSSITTYNDNGTLGAVGKPTPWFEVELIDAAGAKVSTGERGEIVVRTSLPGAITRGYLSNPEATARALRGDAFYTGDLGSFDVDGNMYFHGRMTDNVRVRGENVSAMEVEQVAAKHPAVEDCAMIGVAAEIGEQEIKLFVKRKPGRGTRPARAVGLARRAARALSEPALHRHRGRIRAHGEPAHHEAQACGADGARVGPDRGGADASKLGAGLCGSSFSAPAAGFAPVLAKQVAAEAVVCLSTKPERILTSNHRAPALEPHVPPKGQPLTIDGARIKVIQHDGSILRSPRCLRRCGVTSGRRGSLSVGPSADHASPVNADPGVRPVWDAELHRVRQRAQIALDRGVGQRGVISISEEQAALYVLRANWVLQFGPSPTFRRCPWHPGRSLPWPR